VNPGVAEVVGDQDWRVHQGQSDWFSVADDHNGNMGAHGGRLVHDGPATRMWLERRRSVGERL